MFWKLLMAGF